MATKNKGGRPTKCTQQVADELCAKLADGQSLRSVCADESMPEKSTVLLWVVNGREIDGTGRQFSDQYRVAREAAGYSHADEALDMRSMVYSGEIEPSAAKVILDALKWGAERMAPKAHNPKQEIDHTSSDSSMTPITIDTSKLSTQALEELLGAKQGGSGKK